MGRKKLISESDILKAKHEIQNGVSLRSKAKDLNIHPSSLADRIKKLNNQSSLLKPDTKPDTLKVKSKIKPDIVRRKPDTKPDTFKKHLTISILRGLHELLLGYSDQHELNRKELLDVLIKEFEKQKESIK